MLEQKVKVTNEVYFDDAGAKVPYVAYVMELDSEEFRIVPKKKDKRLISYLIKKYELLPEENSSFETSCVITQEQFRDRVNRRTVDYVAYTLTIADRQFRFAVRDEDKVLIKFLLEEKGFFIDDVDEGDEDDD